jgi:hypothetical protein
MLTLRPATEADCLYLADHLRGADRDEVEAGGSTPLAALLAGLHGSLEVVAGVDERDVPVILSGLCAIPGHPLVGSVWALGSDAVRDHRVSFLRHSRALCQRFHQRFPVLMNLVDSRNTVHIEWLRWMGFTFIRRWPEMGPQRLPFIEFVRLQDMRPLTNPGDAVV